MRRYPIEDLDVVLTDRDRKVGGSTCTCFGYIFTICQAGRLEIRPPFSRDVPFAEWGPGACEKFLMVWSVLTTFGYVASGVDGYLYHFLTYCFSKPLQLSFFTMDEFEQALNHVYSPPTEKRARRHIPLMAEVHATLLLHIRDRPEKPMAGGLYESLIAQENACDREIEKQRVVDWEGGSKRAEETHFVKTSGAEEDVQVHVWRTKLGGIKPQEREFNDLLYAFACRVEQDSAWRKVNIGGVDERTSWEMVIIGCLREVSCDCFELVFRC